MSTVTKRTEKRKSINKQLRKLPSIEKILEREEIQAEADKYSRVLVTEAAQEVIATIREQLLQGDACPSGDEITEKIKQYLAQEG
ncbi:unnamed protein product, partial [marine sediment metagenome]